MDRAAFLRWVRAYCVLTNTQLQTLDVQIKHEDPHPDSLTRPEVTAPTMVFLPAVDTVDDLPPVETDGRACLVLDDDLMFVSVAAIGWVPMRH